MAPYVQKREPRNVSEWLHSVRQKRHFKRASRHRFNLRIDVILTSAIHKAETDEKHLNKVTAEEELQINLFKAMLVKSCQESGFAKEQDTFQDQFGEINQNQKASVKGSRDESHPDELDKLLDELFPICDSDVCKDL